MAIRIGQFLVDRGVISEEQLSLAIHEQLVRQKPLGRVAIESGTMTMREVMRVLGHQGDSGDCLRFGALAIELGYLTDAELETLLWRQRVTRPPLGAVLVEMEALSPKQLQQQLDAFSELKLAETETPVEAEHHDRELSLT